MSHSVLLSNSESNYGVYSVAIYLQVFFARCIFFGIYTVVFVATLYGFSVRPQENKITSRIILGLAVFMYALVLIPLAIAWDSIRTHYLMHPNGIQHITSFKSEPWCGVTVSIMLAVNMLIADFTFIWRCWVMWGRSFRVVSLPFIFGLASTVFATLAWRAQIKLQHAQAVTPSFSVSLAAGYLTSLAATFTVTLLITYRIISLGRTTFDVPKRKRRCRLGCWGLEGKDYTKVVEIIVESAALYSASLIVSLVVFKVRPMYMEEISGIMGVVTGLAPCLIIARVSLRLARPEATWHSKTAMRFGSGGTRYGARSNVGGDGDVEPDASRSGMD